MSGAIALGAPAISIDVEDWPHSTWDRDLPITERAATNTRRLLELLARENVETTMFVLGKFADRFPEVVREIHQAGHEVGCHGWGHVEIFKQTRDEFAADVRRAKDGLEQTLGVAVKGYRAPDFSVVASTLWALETLAETGFVYDSSIFPVRHARYGIVDWPRDPMNVKLRNGLHIAECPIATLRLFGRNLPVGGGGYHRLLPGLVARLTAGQLLRSGLFVFYCHPYEFDPQELWDTRLALPVSLRLHQGLGRGRFEHRFVEFIRRFGGRRMDDFLTQSTLESFDLAAFAGAQARTGPVAA
jgi:polysaccharide deacetylase family protein (PEP-CTERM system associated)